MMHSNANSDSGVVLKPYYDEDGITIYHGDCREILPLLNVVDFVCTDPPYGVGLGIDNNQTKDSSHLAKRGYDGYEDTYENFTAMIVPRLNAAIERAGRAAVFTGPHIHEQRKPSVIGGIWHPSAIGRTPWGSKNFLPVLFYGNPKNPGLHRPTVIRSTAVTEANGHPCPKPIEWIRWLILMGTADEDVVLDPFMGSGTSLLAAKELGRKAIGIEINRRYCDIAVNRLSQSVLPFVALPETTQKESLSELW
jgi:site-specific DNA-methyltransferase (adenine-specific)